MLINDKSLELIRKCTEIASKDRIVGSKAPCTPIPLFIKSQVSIGGTVPPFFTYLAEADLSPYPSRCLSVAAPENKKKLIKLQPVFRIHAILL